jgi:CheY-like chemotaxis protein
MQEKTGARLLVVDDEESIREVLTDFLGRRSP